MSHLSALLCQITKKASHPNSLVYGAQLERAKQKYLVRGELEDGKEGVVALGGPEEDGKREGTEVEVEREKDVDGGRSEARSKNGGGDAADVKPNGGAAAESNAEEEESERSDAKGGAS